MTTGDRDALAPLLDEQIRHTGALAQDVGYSYDRGWLDAGTPETAYDGIWVPTATPGRRIPHAKLADGRSTLDLCEGRWTLVLGAKSAAPEAIPSDVNVVHIDTGVLAGADRDLHELFGVPLTGAVLIRPDQHVALRTSDAVDPARVTALAGHGNRRTVSA